MNYIGHSDQIEENVHGREFTKHDKQKPRFSLVPIEAIEALIDILEFGAKKYAPYNWKKCEDVTRYEDALFRHLFAHKKGEKLDPESGRSHLAHALCNLAFLVYFEVKK